MHPYIRNIRHIRDIRCILRIWAGLKGRAALGYGSGHGSGALPLGLLCVCSLWVLCSLWALFCPPHALAAEERKRSWQIDDTELDGPTDIPGYSVNDLRALAETVVRTGVKMGEIPAVIKPIFLTISDASLSMEDDEIVFVVQHGPDLVRIYPRNILVWHETVNDTVPVTGGHAGWPLGPGTNERGEEGFVISYSPLSGSVVGFRALAGKYPSYFGSTGTLLDGNSVLFDFISHSMWSQLLYGSFEGPFRGKRLDRIQVTWARWGGVKERYSGLNTLFNGKAEVLSRATGHRRTYGRDPYGKYDEANGYYNNTIVPFTLSSSDDRLPPKTRVLGLELGKDLGAVQVNEIKKVEVLNFELGPHPLVAVYDREIDAVRVFARQLDDRPEPLTFALHEGALIDKETTTEWSPTGLATSGLLRDKQLAETLSTDSMWFAWSTFYRGSRIIPQPAEGRVEW